MKKAFSPFYFPLRLLAFWLTFFAAFRLWFVLWFRAKWSPGGGSVWAAFWEALPLDLSTAGYLLMLPLLVFFVALAGNEAWKNISRKIIFGYNVLIISVMVLIFGSNVFLYEEWQTLLNNRALEYMKGSPAALTDSMSVGFQIVSVGLYLGLVWLWVWICRRFVGKEIFPVGVSKWAFGSVPLQLGCLFLMIRGGLGVMPINESAVYFSGHLFDNHAATNSAWHLIHSMVETRAERNPFEFFEKGKAAKIRREIGLHDYCGLVNCSVIDTSIKKPNIVFLILESHTAQVIEELGGRKGVCPNLSRLISEGVLFTQCYGSGYRTDQGLVSILSGYPAQPDQSVILQEEKSSKLPSLTKALRENGYRTAYLYGGELTFANIGVYLANQGFEKIISEKDFSGAEKTQRWGADDGILLNRAAAEFSKMREPFFGVAMTLSLHPPFDVPFESQWANFPADTMKFLNAAAFADHAVGRFFEKAKTAAWYKNTVFVLVADHGASNPGRVPMSSPVSRHVPLIFFGEPLTKEFRGLKIDVFANHSDIPATVLGSFVANYHASETQHFLWSKSLFSAELEHSKKPGSAFYTNENGLGWINQQGAGFMNFETREWEFFRGSLDSVSREQAKAWLQVFYGEYLGL